MRVAYTLEQCWHRVPGGTGIAALEVARELSERPDLEVIGVAGRHRRPPTAGFAPTLPVAHLPLGGPLLYESWTRLRWPLVESVVEGADLVHSTTIIPPATSLPLVATIHDVAFLRHPEFFTDRGNRVFRRSLDILRERATIVLCSSMATLNDCAAVGFARERLRHVPLGVSRRTITDEDRLRVRRTHGLPGEFILFVGTLEPRKNLARLLQALESIPDAPPLVVVGMEGWGETVPPSSHHTLFTGFVPAGDLPAIYEACSLFAFPSVLEGYGLPVIEAMAHGAAVVTSAGTATEEVAGGAAVLVDPLDVASIAAGIVTGLGSRDELRVKSSARASQVKWSMTADLTVSAYRDALGAVR